MEGLDDRKETLAEKVGGDGEEEGEDGEERGDERGE